MLSLLGGNIKLPVELVVGELVAAWDRHHVVDRLMGNADWMNFLDKPINPEK